MGESPFVQSIILSPHTNVDKVKIYGKYPGKNNFKLLVNSEVKTNEIFLDEPTKLKEVKIEFTKSLDNKINYEIQIGIMACFKFEGRESNINQPFI